MNATQILVVTALLIALTQAARSEPNRLVPASSLAQAALAEVEAYVLIAEERGTAKGGWFMQRSIEFNHLKKIPNIRGKFYIEWLKKHKDRCLAQKEQLLTSGMGKKHPEAVLLDDRIRIANSLIDEAQKAGMNRNPADK